MYCIAHFSHTNSAVIIMREILYRSEVTAHCMSTVWGASTQYRGSEMFPQMIRALASTYI